MNNWHPNIARHKAQHGGYKGKPTKGEVNGLLSLYSGCKAIKTKSPMPVSKKEIGVQLKITF